MSPRRTQYATALHAFLPHVAVLEFPDDAAVHYAQIRADLKKRGQMIGANDLFIAAHARRPGAQAGHEQYRRIQSRERSDARELGDASGSSCARDRREVAAGDDTRSAAKADRGAGARWEGYVIRVNRWRKADLRRSGLWVSSPTTRVGPAAHVATEEQYQTMRDAGALHDDVVRRAADAVLFDRARVLLLPTGKSS